MKHGTYSPVVIPAALSFLEALSKTAGTQKSSLLTLKTQPVVKLGFGSPLSCEMAYLYYPQ